MTLIDRLLNLFRVESQLRALQSRLDGAQRYMNAQTRLLEGLQSEKTELESRRKQLRATIGNLESETASIDERLEKLRNELNSAATNKQYNALLSEVNVAKEERGKLEEEMLQHMEQVEEIEQKLGELADQLKEREKVGLLAEQQLAERKDDVGERLAELKSQREAASSDIPDDVMRVFDELSDNYDGEVMATVEEISKRHREYACGECNMQMPFEAVSQLRNAGDTVVRCPACTRILYIAEQHSETLAKH